MSFGLNTLGTPKTGDYYLGRGNVYLSLLDATSNLPLKWRHIGNATQFKASIKNAKVQHYDSMNALKRADDEVATQQDVTLMFTADELSAENCAQFFSAATPATYTNPAIAGFTNATLVANANAAAGAWYDIQTTAGARAYDLATADVAISVTAPATVATLVDGTDYNFDGPMGRFQLTAAGLTKVNTGGAGIIKVIVSAAAGASPTVRTKGCTSSPVRVAVKFVPLNAKSPNDRQEIQFHSVMLTGDGDFSLIDDKYTTMDFNGLCGKNTQVDSTSPYFTITSLTTPRS